MNYLWGFLSSAFLYSLLHWIIPSRPLDNFVKGNASVKELQELYRDRWDVIEAESSEAFSEEVSTQQKKDSDPVIAYF